VEAGLKKGGQDADDFQKNSDSCYRPAAKRHDFLNFRRTSCLKNWISSGKTAPSTWGGRDVWRGGENAGTMAAKREGVEWDFTSWQEIILNDTNEWRGRDPKYVRGERRGAPKEGERKGANETGVVAKRKGEEAVYKQARRKTNEGPGFYLEKKPEPEGGQNVNPL